MNDETFLASSSLRLVYFSSAVAVNLQRFDSCKKECHNLFATGIDSGGGPDILAYRVEHSVG